MNRNLHLLILPALLACGCDSGGDQPAPRTVSKTPPAAAPEVSPTPPAAPVPPPLPDTPAEALGLYDPGKTDQARARAGNGRSSVFTGWWPPDDQFWEIRRYKPGDPRFLADMTVARREKQPDRPISNRFVQKRPYSANPADFDDHCAAEQKADRIGLLQVAPARYALCVKAANGVWVAIPGEAIKTSEELWPTAYSGPPKRKWPIIGGYYQDDAIGTYGDGPGEIPP